MTAVLNMQQGSQEWLELRKTKITATDAPVILGMSPWKNKVQLYNEKMDLVQRADPTPRMLRGTELEPIARNLFILESGLFIEPAIIIKDWAMASLDGISRDGKIIVEIKCPGEKDHAMALRGEVPRHYFAQIQHQLYVADADSAYYYSFDGDNGVAVAVFRDESFISRMVEEEKVFYNCLQNKTPPPDEIPTMTDSAWLDAATRYCEISARIKALEKEEEELRKRLIFLSGESPARGGGICLSSVCRKGPVDYSNIPALQGVDLEPYRKPSMTCWKITIK